MKADTLNGIDVSHFQGDIDWQKVRAAGKAFAFAKATEGSSFRDPKFQQNWYGMQQNNLLRGAYHFFHANQDPNAQMQNLLAFVNFEANDLIALDIEVDDGVDNATFLHTISQCVTILVNALDKHPFIYTMQHFWNTHIPQTPESLTACPLWVADWNQNPPRLPNGWQQWTAWQTSEKGQVGGIQENVDIDVLKIRGQGVE